jgi:hypothetical protein
MKDQTRLLLAAACAIALPAWCAAAAPEGRDPNLAEDLAMPVQVRAGGKPINVTIGHAAPYLADMDGDGKRDLLVGQFGDGALRIYTNLGTDTRPEFEDKFEWFMAGGVKGTVPFG